MPRGLTSFPTAFSGGYSLNPADFGGMLSECYIGGGGGSPYGRVYWVDGGAGALAASGQGTPANPYTTMAQAFAKVASGDTIIFKGNIREQLTTPAGIFGVTIIGGGTRPRHADGHTGTNGYMAATWKAPASPTAATPLCKVLQQGWRFERILFAAPSDSYAIQLFRDAGAGDAERDSGHAEIVGCRFASGGGGINDPGGNVNVLVQGNRFEALTTACILGVGNIGVGQSDWLIVDNVFDGFTNGVKIAAFGCRIQNNTFTAGGTPNTTFVLNTSNGGGADNFVIENWFQGTTANFNTPDVVGNATDVWYNHALDTQAAGVNGVYEVGQPA